MSRSISSSSVVGCMGQPWRCSRRAAACALLLSSGIRSAAVPLGSMRVLSRMQMTRVALIPYALQAHAMWASAQNWLGHDVGVVVCDGLSLAFTEAEEELLTFRAGKRRDAGAPISLVSGKRAQESSRACATMYVSRAGVGSTGSLMPT